MHAPHARTHACTDEQMNKYSYLAILKRYCYQHSCRPCSPALALAFSLSRTHPPAVPCIHVDTAVDDSNDNGNHSYLYSHSCTESYCTDSYTQAANLNYEQPVKDNNDVNCLQGVDDGVTALRARGEGIKGAYHWYTLVRPFLHNRAPHQYLFEVAPHQYLFEVAPHQYLFEVTPSIATCCKFTCCGVCLYDVIIRHGWKNGDSYSFFETSNANGSTKVLKVLADCCSGSGGGRWVQPQGADT